MTEVKQAQVSDNIQNQTSSSGSDNAQSLSNVALDEMIRAKKAAGSNGADQSSSGSGSTSGAIDGMKNQRPGESQENGDSRKQTQRDSGDRNEIIEHLRSRLHQLVGRPTKDGVTELGTGDKLVKDGDREILFMPNGDKITVNKDGSFDLKTNGPVQVKKDGDSTTITYPNGDKVVIGKNGVDMVTRGNMTVDIIDKNLFNHFPGDRLPQPQPKPYPFPGQNPGGNQIPRDLLPNDSGVKGK